MVDAMRAMLDELMGEDRDGDRQKYVPEYQASRLDQESCKSCGFSIGIPLSAAGPLETSLMKTFANTISAGFVHMKNLIKPGQTLVPVLKFMMTAAKGNGKP